ncbi:hypothetical protein GH714_032071 [Hevea brasiliensis]|uniref:Glutaredoxin domain-containing protein n=1 Tax=Hevea brasiliensis TaxID=3981 RepID=A0A6A6NDX9_HEVBR|nr:hypothetical protein GH714_032071 [Hevea brasiliensis]
MGVNPTVHELDEDPRGKEMEKALMRLLGSSSAVPVVFIGGKLVGAMDRVMASHINGTLVPLLKDAVKKAEEEEWFLRVISSILDTNQMMY